MRHQKLPAAFSGPAQGYRRADRRRRSRLVSGMPQRRFPPPWSAEETEACFIVRDAKGQALAYVYFEEEPGPRGGQAAHARRGSLARRGASYGGSPT